MFLLHVKCLHVLYDSYGPPYLICNRHCMIPHMYIVSLHMYNMKSMALMVPHTLYGIGILWSPSPYVEQLLYGPPHVCV